MILFIIATIAIFAASVFLLLKVAKWLGGKKAVWIVGALLVGLIAFEIVGILHECGAEPVFVPPECDEPNRCGIGRMIFACDGPVGAVAYGLAYLLGPVAGAIVTVFTFLVARRPRNMEMKA